jgi:predicted acylesterase/phospholipase RssA
MRRNGAVWFPGEEIGVSTIVVVFIAVVLLVVMVAMVACFILRRCTPLDLLLRSVRWLYLLRVPLLSALGIAGLCLAVWLGGARSLLGGVFDIGTNRWGAFFVSLTAFLTAWVVMASWRLVRLYGPTRMFERPAPPITFRPAEREDEIYLALYYLLVLLVAFPVVWLTLTTSNASAAQMLMAFLGFGASLACIGIVAFAQLFLNRLWGVDSETPDLFLPTRLPPFNRIFDTVRGNDHHESEGESDSRWFGQLPEDMFRGYLHYEESRSARNRRATYILPGHVAAFVLLCVTLAAYMSLGAIKFVTFGDDPMVRPDRDLPFFPALCYILLLAALFCWAFSSVAFFLDRYRVPVLVPLALLLAVTSALPWSDYRFPVEKIRPSSSEEVAQTTDEPTVRGDGAQDGSKNDSIIVVAVNGGGIQAAAWAAQVLAGLEEACREEPCGRQFDEEIRLISSVSGGSVGTMYFVNEYTDGHITEGADDANTELHRIVTRAEGSSIDEVSWGVLYPDLIRGVLSMPLPPGWDRGRALEEAWLRLDIPWSNREGIKEGLSDWHEDAENRDRPAVIFNTTVTESGQRLPLATTDLPEGTAGRLTYDQLLTGNEGMDIPVVTAARLSASFPYVSPAVRADVEGPGSHLVDGGYYDNYGISSLVEWLDEELRTNQDIDKVLIIEIRGSPSPPSYTYDDADACPPKPSDVVEERRSSPSWFYQYTAPLRTVLGVRRTGQRAHNDLELDLLVDKWDEQDKANEQDKQGGREPHRVEITRALFEFDRGDPPLSWHLSAGDKERIKDNWDAEIDEWDNACAGWEKVKTFLEKDAGDARTQ